MTKNSPPSIDQHLCFQLYTTSLRMTQLYKPLLEKLKLTYPQYLVMVVLWEQQGIGLKDLAEKLHQDSGSVTPLVKRLEAEGYLLRRRDPQDERSLILTLTPAGETLRKQAYEVSQAIQSACNIDEKGFLSLMRGLASLQKELDK
ncbi:MarR family winged helix-turn-helix transcriptional regulator [Undibacterium terreum]|uniref:MarR family transcriptional regulator n=1 Tax=Undibacterium terreum TaxID=1224302 RepID=A0A916UE29_9BURK|nr:MarR family transcriptional regulator [Undibacterium terreum]GGC69358.1 MarR family transcriptional regulator [Undibacterium terreum]